MFLALVGTLLSVPSCAGKHRSKEPPPPPEQAYQMAIAKMEKKRYYTARTMLQALLPRIAPDDRDLLPKVQLAIADAYFKDGGLLNYGEALNAYRNFIIYYPQHPSSDRAQFMVAMSLFKQVPAPDRDQALTLKAIEEFNKVAATYPDSTFAQKAREQVILCQDELAEHERLVGWFYQRRKAYGAALDRYHGIIERYPRARSINRVLYDMGRCQIALGHRIEAEEVLGQLFHDSPNDPLVRKAKALLDEFYKKAEKQDREARKQ